MKHIHWALLCLAGFAPDATAQLGLVGSQRTLPFGFDFEDSPGATTLVGTHSSESFGDSFGNDSDIQVDCPGGGDGKKDYLDTRDGDNLDSMLGGAEDSFVGDEGDHVTILTPVDGAGGQRVLWHGTYAEYKRTRAMVRWLQDRVTQVISGEDMPGGTGLDALIQAGLDLLAHQPSGYPMPFSSELPIGPYYLLDWLPSPADFLTWCPFEEETFPDTQVIALSLSHEEYVAAKAGALDLLAYAIEVVTSSDAE